MTRYVISKLPDSIPPNEKCDRCPAYARLMVLVGDREGGVPIGPLSFCYHHGNQHEVGLFGAVKILDVRDDRAEWSAAVGRDTLGGGTHSFA